MNIHAHISRLDITLFLSVKKSSLNYGNMSAPAPTRTQILHMYKDFIRNANKIQNYNFRHYFLRRAKESFRENKNVQDPKKVNELLTEAEKDLGVLKRQSIISNMYTFDKLVVEPLKKR